MEKKNISMSELFEVMRDELSNNGRLCFFDCLVDFSSIAKFYEEGTPGIFYWAVRQNGTMINSDIYYIRDNALDRMNFSFYEISFNGSLFSIEDFTF